MKLRFLLLIVCLLCAAVSRRDAISLDVRGARLSDVLLLVATQAGKNVIAANDAGNERVTLHLRDAAFERILQVLADLYRLQITRKGDIYFMSRAAPIQVGQTEGRFSVALITPLVPEESASPVAASEVRSIRLRGISPSAAVNTLRDVLPPATYISDDRRSAVLVVANGATVNAARHILESADQPTPRVVLAVRLFSVRLIPDETNLSQELNDSPVVATGQATYAFATGTRVVESGVRLLIDTGRAKPLGEWRFSARIGETVRVAAGGPDELQATIRPLSASRELSMEVHLASGRPERTAAFDLRSSQNQSIFVGGIRRAHIKDETCLLITPRLVGSARVHTWRELQRGAPNP